MQKSVQLEEIAILGRNIYLHNDIKSLLDKEGIEYNIGTIGRTILETKEANIFLNTIKLMDNPYNEIIRNFFIEMFSFQS